MKTMMKDYEIIEHTADIGIAISAENKEMLFMKAAYAMFDIMAEPKGLLLNAENRLFGINLKAENAKELLVAWLSELLSVSDCESIIFTGFEIKRLTDTTIDAIATGSDTKYFKGKSAIKAVTYHELELKEEDGKFKAQVIFDS